MKESLKNLQTAFNEVFTKNSYIALSSALAIIVFIFAVWLPNLGLIGEIFSTSSTPLATKIKIAVSLLGGIATNFNFLSAGYTIAIAVLFGINLAMVVYSMKHTRAGLDRQNLTVGLGGIASGALGIGCAVCGSFILSTTLSSVGAAGALAILPLHGGEFGILSVILLVFSLIFISNKIAAPLKCKVKCL
ncbi:MAG: hypothetical protein G01um10142_111 [Parcubacteria group bacterium Gr01-1014_2]|nr:MAG: hypothetical protein G01um10142_111 [Parcubacteria group bacterium Gr01-1014_2]